MGLGFTPELLSFRGFIAEESAVDSAGLSCRRPPSNRRLEIIRSRHQVGKRPMPHYARVFVTPEITKTLLSRDNCFTLPQYASAALVCRPEAENHSTPHAPGFGFGNVKILVHTHTFSRVLALSPHAIGINPFRTPNLKEISLMMHSTRTSLAFLLAIGLTGMQ